MNTPGIILRKIPGPPGWLLLFLLMALSPAALAQDAREIVKKAEEKMQGNSSEGEMEMTIVRPSWKRSVTIRTWSKGRDYSLALVTAPAKEKGQSFLKRKNEMWNWNPTISRMIKLPPSMMSQGWMGSDYTNDDMLKESSIVYDYAHRLLASEKTGGSDCWLIELKPLESAAVVWGKILLWISKDEYLEMKAEFYDEDDILVKTHLCSDIRLMHDRRIPCRYEILPADKPGQKTLVVIRSMKFNHPLKDDFFSQQNMKTLH